jgi:hypothetical protein
LAGDQTVVPIAIDKDMLKTVAATNSQSADGTSAIDGWMKGNTYEANGEHADALFWYERSAISGSADSAFEIGSLYLFGLGVAKNPSMAFRWYTVAASRGSTLAMLKLSALCLHGNGVAKDENLALSWARKAADGGESDATQFLVTSYQNGTPYLRKDDSWARMWSNWSTQQILGVAPICQRKDVQARMAVLVTQAYTSLTDVLDATRTLIDPTSTPIGDPGPARSVTGAEVTKTHGPSGFECKAYFSPYPPFWMFKINVVKENGRDYYSVTKATAAQQATMVSLQLGLAMSGNRTFMVGFHDIHDFDPTDYGPDWRRQTTVSPRQSGGVAAPSSIPAVPSSVAKNQQVVKVCHKAQLLAAPPLGNAAKSSGEVLGIAEPGDEAILLEKEEGASKVEIDVPGRKYIGWLSNSAFCSSQ